jgi:hypothetical protein
LASDRGPFWTLGHARTLRRQALAGATRATGQALVGTRRLGFGSLLAFIHAIVRIDWPLGALRNIDHRPARADARNIDHRNRLAGRNARRQWRPDSARRQLRKARRHHRGQPLIGVVRIDRIDGKPLIGMPLRPLDAIAGIDRATPAPTGQMTRALGTIPSAFGTTAPTGKPLTGASAFIDAVVRIDRASRVIEMNWCNPN